MGRVAARDQRGGALSAVPIGLARGLWLCCISGTNPRGWVELTWWLEGTGWWPVLFFRDSAFAYLVTRGSANRGHPLCASSQRGAGMRSGLSPQRASEGPCPSPQVPLGSGGCLRLAPLPEAAFRGAPARPTLLGRSFTPKYLEVNEDVDRLPERFRRDFDGSRLPGRAGAAVCASH